MNLNQYSIAAAQPGLSVERIERLQLPVPPLDEQEQIVRMLDAQTAELRKAIVRIEQEITLLDEFRRSLIAEAVTGKLDIREVAASLPDNVDGPDPLETEDVIDEFEDSASEDFEPEEAAA